MAPSGGNQGIGLRRFCAGYFEKHQLRLGFGVFSLKGSCIPSTIELTSSSTRTELTYPGRKCKTTTCSGSTFKVTIRACGSSACASI
jgi:hypothetical protein